MRAGVRALPGARYGVVCGGGARRSARGVWRVVSALARRGRGRRGCAARCARGELVQRGQQGTKLGVSLARGQVWTPQDSNLSFSSLFEQNFGGRFDSGNNRSDICVGKPSSLRGLPRARADADGRGVPLFNKFSPDELVCYCSVTMLSVGGGERDSLAVWRDDALEESGQGAFRYLCSTGTSAFLRPCKDDGLHSQ